MQRRISIFGTWSWQAHALAYVLALAVAGASRVLAAEPVEGWRILETAGTLPAGITEASGLAASRRAPGLYWTHGDSGGEPVLSAIAADGALRGKLRIAGVKNVDWEDAASFTLDGRAWLLVADTGDNRSVRGDCALLVVAEPDPAELAPDRESVVEPAWRLPVVYPDGPRDCEAVAVDAWEGKVYLLAKRTMPHGLYTLPLRPTSAGARPPEGATPMVAERVGEVRDLPPAPEAERRLRTPSGMYRAQPTGMDFAADGSAAVLVSYGEVLVYPKTKDETWAQALGRPGRVVGSHGLAQAEAVAFGAEGSEIVVTGEGAGAPVVIYRRAPGG